MTALERPTHSGRTMLSVAVRIISIGALAAHPLWNEKGQVRTGHATTTLIDSGKAHILVDPGLPPQIIVPRLAERAGLTPDDITHIFLTSFKADTARGMLAFEGSRWMISEAEREGVGIPLATALRAAHEEGDAETFAALQRQVAMLQRCEVAEDSIAPHVDLFPLPGVTPGLCGLLIAEQRHTTLICGDAIPTIEHLDRGMVLQNAVRLEQAKESLLEAVEIADLLVLGRDNMVVNPGRRPF